MGMRIRMGMGVSLQPFRCPLGLPRALHSASFSPACRAASSSPGLTSPDRRGRGQGLSTSRANTRAGTPAGAFPTPLSFLSFLSALQSRGSKWRLLHGSPQPLCRWSRSWMRGFACVIPSASGACLAQARLLRGPAARSAAEQGTRTSLGLSGGWRMGNILPGSPPPPIPWGTTRAHSFPAVALPGGPEGTGKGLSHAVHSQG